MGARIAGAILAAVAALPPLGWWPAGLLPWMLLLSGAARARGAARAAGLGAAFGGALAAYAFLGAMSYSPPAFAGGARVCSTCPSSPPPCCRASTRRRRRRAGC